MSTAHDPAEVACPPDLLDAALGHPDFGWPETVRHQPIDLDDPRVVAASEARVAAGLDPLPTRRPSGSGHGGDGVSES